MSYTREKLQILGGGFNLLPPADKTPKADYRLAQNWRVDRSGKLVSRWGYPLKFSIPGIGYAHSAANNGGDESNYYVAANNSVGASPGKVYFNATGSPIMTGLSGKRVGFASMLGWMFIADRAAQGRHNGVRFHTWGIDPPTTALTPANGAAHVGGTTGQYSFYVTYESTDHFYETGPGPVSVIITTAAEDIDFSAIPISPDAEVGFRNIYAVGGTLGAAYLVATISNNTATASIAGTDNWNTNDLIVTEEDVVMPTTHDQPPMGAAGLAGPYFSRLYTWVGNRLYYTPPANPQYWSTDPDVGDWVDVGSSGENIQWVTCHTNVLMIYKQKSIWRLVGDIGTGSLEQVEEGVGLTSPFAITAGAGGIDYFISPNGLRVCNLDKSALFGAEISPLFNTPLTNNGSPMQPPGGILPGPDYVATIDSIDAYAIALGFAMGKLYLSYMERVVGGPGYGSVTLVYDEQSQQWMYHRSTNIDRFYGFYFDGFMMVGLTGVLPGISAALGYSLDDFRNYYTLDQPAVLGDPGNVLECVYQSRFEDAGQPDNEKMWLEVVVDYTINSGDTATVYVNYDNYPDFSLASVGNITGGGLRKQTSFALGFDGALAKNISVLIDGSFTDQVEIHNVYLYYYVEARLALVASSLPTDLGTAAVKQCKELLLDIDTSYGAGTTVGVNVYSDLPGNALAVRHSPVVPAMGGRGLVKFPFALTMGYLWRIALTAASPFRIYNAWLLSRVVGTFVEAYESAAGFIWDSGPLSFESGITHIPRGYAIALAAVPIKRYREISIEIETFGGDVHFDFLTDLPGDVAASRITFTLNTAVRQYVRLPLPAGRNPQIEGRICQIQTSGASGYIIYDLTVETLSVGVYIEAAEAAGGVIYDSRECDFGSSKPKEARELELDIETTGAVVATLHSDLPGYAMVQRFQNVAITTGTNGRMKIRLPLTLDTAPYDWPIGRLFQLTVGGTHAFRLYGAKLLVREIGCYLTGDEASASPVGLFDTTPIDLESERLKEFKHLEVEIQTEGTVTLKVWTDQPAGAMTLQFTKTISTSGGRQSVKVPLTSGIRGRLIQVEVAGAGVILFNGRVYWRSMNDPKAVWAWSALPIPPTPPAWNWMPFPVSPTDAQWFWAKCLTVEPTSDIYTAVEIPFEVTG